MKTNKGMHGMRRALLFVSAVAALAVLPVGVSACSGDDAMVTGTVMKLDRSALPPDAVVKIELQDISKADAAATVLSSQEIELGGNQLPVPFELSYSEGDIDDRFTYAVMVRIEAGGSLLYINDTVFPVITGGNPTENVEVVVVPVG
ncbi:MAG: YbaY family lipoprotein [Actinomycetota bacterium]